jgi:hypothetical protein
VRQGFLNPLDALVVGDHHPVRQRQHRSADGLLTSPGVHDVLLGGQVEMVPFVDDAPDHAHGDEQGQNQKADEKQLDGHRRTQALEQFGHDLTLANFDW